MLADPELTASLLTNYVESRTVQLLDLNRLRCESPVNVDKNLVEIIGDLRFSTVFKKSKRQSNVFVFLAHQSTIDDLMCFRALEEVAKSYREYIDTLKRKGKGRPKSFPYPFVVILYHGKQAWSKFKRMRDMIEGDPEPGLVWSVNVSNADIFFASNTVLGAIFIHATKLIETIHDRFSVVKSLENERLMMEGNHAKFRKTHQYYRTQGKTLLRFFFPQLFRRRFRRFFGWKRVRWFGGKRFFDGSRR